MKKSKKLLDKDNVDNTGWVAAEHKEVFILSGGGITNENELLNKLESVLGKKLYLNAEHIQSSKCVTAGRCYYGVCTARDDLDLDEIVNNFACNADLPDYYVHENITTNDESNDAGDKLRKALVIISHPHLARMYVKELFGYVAGLSGALFLSFISFMGIKYVFPKPATLNLFLLVIASALGLAIGITMSGCFLSVFRATVQELHQNMKMCRSLKNRINSLKLRKYLCNDRILYIIDNESFKNDWGNAELIADSVNKMISKDINLSTLGLEAHSASDNSIYLTRDYTPEETIPEDARFDSEDIVSQTIENRSKKLKKWHTPSKTEQVSKVLLNSIIIPDAGSNTDDAYNKAKLLCRNIKKLESECLNSTTISDKVYFKLDTLEKLNNDDGLAEFISQLEDIKSSFEKLKSNDKSLESSMMDINAIIGLRAQSKVRSE